LFALAGNENYYHKKNSDFSRRAETHRH